MASQLTLSPLATPQPGRADARPLLRLPPCAAAPIPLLAHTPAAVAAGHPFAADIFSDPVGQPGHCWHVARSPQQPAVGE